LKDTLVRHACLHIKQIHKSDLLSNLYLEDETKHANRAYPAKSCLDLISISSLERAGSLVSILRIKEMHCTWPISSWPIHLPFTLLNWQRWFHPQKNIPFLYVEEEQKLFETTNQIIIGFINYP
jgi:hypothetical protein